MSGTGNWWTDPSLAAAGTHVSARNVEQQLGNVPECLVSMGDMGREEKKTRASYGAHCADKNHESPCPRS